MKFFCFYLFCFRSWPWRWSSSKINFWTWRFIWHWSSFWKSIYKKCKNGKIFRINLYYIINPYWWIFRRIQNWTLFDWLKKVFWPIKKYFLISQKLQKSWNFNQKRWKMKFLTDQKKIFDRSKKFFNQSKNGFWPVKKTFFLTSLKND